MILLKKAQCIYCGKIIYVDPSYGIGQDELYEDDRRRKKVNRLERCPSNRTSSRELGFHKYSIIN